MMLFGQQRVDKENIKVQEQERRRAAASTYSRAADDALPGFLLKNLRAQIDPLGKSGTAIDPCVLNLDNIQAILDDFSTIFDHMDQRYNRKGFHDGDIPNLTHTAHQIDGLWLYFVFSNYVHHWGAENAEMSAKRQKIQEFERINLKLIGRILNSIERSYDCLTRNPNMGDHQRLLMIQGYLGEFIKRQSGDTKEVLAHIPVAFPARQLASSQSVVSQRKSGSASRIEASVNAQLFASLSQESFPDAFAPQKQNPNDSFIDATTGLELDFPLRSQITIETDGGQYHQGAFGRHDMVHTFKAAILRQSDWVRIAFSPTFEQFGQYSNPIMLKRITDLLRIPFVHDFHLQYQQLLDLRGKIRKDVDILQNIVLFKRPELYANESKYLDDLLALESQIQTFIGKRHLESLLREPVLMYGFSTPDEGLQFKQELMSKHAIVLQRQTREIDAHQRLQESNTRFDEVCQQVEMANARCEGLQDELEKLEQKLQGEQERRAKHYARYKQLQQQTPQNKAQLDEVVAFLKELDTKSIPNKKHYIAELKQAVEQAQDELTEKQSSLQFRLRQKQSDETSYDQAKTDVLTAKTELAVFAERVLPLQELMQLTHSLCTHYSQLQKPRSLESQFLAPAPYIQSSSSHGFSGSSSSYHQSSSYAQTSFSEFESSPFEQTSQEIDFKENKHPILMFTVPVETTSSRKRDRNVMAHQSYSTDMYLPETKRKDTKPYEKPGTY